MLQLEEQVSRLQREKNDLQSRMEEDQEDMNELMKKHKAAVAQVTTCLTPRWAARKTFENTIFRIPLLLILRLTPLCRIQRWKEVKLTMTEIENLRDSFRLFVLIQWYLVVGCHFSNPGIHILFFCIFKSDGFEVWRTCSPLNTVCALQSGRCNLFCCR